MAMNRQVCPCGHTRDIHDKYGCGICTCRRPKTEV